MPWKDPAGVLGLSVFLVIAIFQWSFFLHCRVASLFFVISLCFFSCFFSRLNDQTVPNSWHVWRRCLVQCLHLDPSIRAQLFFVLHMAVNVIGDGTIQLKKNLLSLAIAKIYIRKQELSFPLAETVWNEELHPPAWSLCRCSLSCCSCLPYLPKEYVDYAS